MEGTDETPDGDMAKVGRLLVPEDKVYDLVDIYDDQGGMVLQEEMRGAGIAEQGGEGILKSGDNIFDLVDVVEEGQGISCLYPALNEEIMESVSQITEKIAREMIPDIAARAVREEIERFKRSG
ncbi:MAG: hypothetical protein Q7J31_00155 [Syntrophales bacterium]|nr:hypothetical protein [Syntrophales bacterium]